MATNIKTPQQGKNNSAAPAADAKKGASKRTHEGLILRAFEKRRPVPTIVATTAATEEDNTSYILGYN